MNSMTNDISKCKDVGFCLYLKLKNSNNFMFYIYFIWLGCLSYCLSEY